MQHSDLIADTFQCTRCHKKFYEDGFNVNRLGHRLKTCLECNSRERLRNKPLVEYDYSCEHIANRNACAKCNPQSAAMRKNNRDVTKFSTTPWPEPHICTGSQFSYDYCVVRRKAQFTAMRDYRLITDEVLDKIMANLQPRAPVPPPENFDKEIDELLAEF